MSSRQEQFNQDRQKMLKAIGAEPDEPEIEHTPSVEPEEFDDDFSDRLKELQFGNPSANEYEARVANAFDEECEFDESLRELNSEEKKQAKKRRHNQRVRAKERLESKGPVSPFGLFWEIIDDCHATAGGRLVYMLYIAFFILPLAYFWIEAEGLFAALLVSLVFITIGRIATMGLSILCTGLMTITTSQGPIFVCDIREGSPALKMFFSLVNKVFWLTQYSFFFFFVGMWYLTITNATWTAERWIHGYCWGFALSLTFPVFLHFLVANFGFAIYTRICSIFLSSGKQTKYRLRYFYDRGRVMVPTRSAAEGWVGLQERMQAFSRDYGGMAK